MAGLIGDLLDAGRIGAGVLAVDPAPEDVTGLGERARTPFTGGGGRHAVVMDLPSGLPRVMVDSRRIVQVLNNLFSNAARHSLEATPIRPEMARMPSSESDYLIGDKREVLRYNEKEGSRAALFHFVSISPKTRGLAVS